MKILVVDDEELIRNVIREYLSIEGYDVDEARDGDDAIDKCRYNDYSLIIMDIMMPHKDGYQACKEIKQMKDIPFIMLSARSEEYDKLNAKYDLLSRFAVLQLEQYNQLAAKYRAIQK